MDDYKRMERYGKIQRLNTRTTDPIPLNDPRWHPKAPDRKYGPVVATLFLLVILAMVWIGIVLTVRYTFSYSPVIPSLVDRSTYGANQLEVGK